MMIKAYFAIRANNEEKNMASSPGIGLMQLAEWLLPSVFFVAVLTGCGAATVQDGSFISLSKPDGTHVLVPLNGPLHAARTDRLAREVQSLDKIIATRKDSARSQSEAAVIMIAVESRNDALKELELALRIAQQTSAGQLDDGILQKAERYCNGSREALNSPVPTAVFVTTHISTSLSGATLHYMSKGDYDANKKLSWASYSEGDKLRIGRYVFRVEPHDPNYGVYDELILVVADPTNRLITPLRGASL